MRKSLVILFIVLTIATIGLAYVNAQLDIGVGDGSETIINLVPPEPDPFNNNTGSVNFSQFADIWITNEGNKDNVANILIDELGDVDTTGVSTNDFLQKSATDWVDFNLFATANDFTATQTFSATTDSIGIAQRNVHDGDLNTYWEYTNDKITGVVGGITFITMTEGVVQDTFDLGVAGTTFLSMNEGVFGGTNIFRVNPNSNNQDFNVIGDLDFNLIFGDASTNRVGIGTSTPDTLFHVAGSAHIDTDLTVNGDTNITGTIFGGRQIFSAYDSAGGTTFTNTKASLPLGTENRKDSFYLHSTSGDSNVTVKRAGDYWVEYDVTARQTVANTRRDPQCFIEVNNVVVVGTNSTIYQRNNVINVGDRATMHSRLIITLSVNDEIDVTCIHIAASTTSAFVQGHSRLNLEFVG